MYKIAYINYLNSQPLYFGLDHPEVQLRTGNPVEIINWLHEGFVDAGQLSVYEYLQHKEKFHLHKNFCISAFTGKICSVLLLSKSPIEELNGQTITLTNQSRTSVQLLKIILALRYNSSSGWVSSSVQNESLLNGEIDNVLLIGDQALWAWQMKQKGSLSQYFTYDLASEWFNWTALPFVFAVFVSQKDKLLPLTLENYLEKHLQNNLNEIQQIIDSNLHRGISQRLMAEYFQLLDYKLDGQRGDSMRRFDELTS